MRVKFLHQQLSDFSLAQKYEWLETNNIGSYASSTILGCHSRKYHGLLVAKLPQRTGKFVMLSQYEDSLSFAEKNFFLCTHTYQNAVYPEGYQCLAEYQSFPCPTFVYRLGDVTVFKEILLHPHDNCTFVRYRSEGISEPVLLKIRPLLALRNYHELTKESFQFQVRTFPCKQGFFLTPYQEMPSMYFQLNAKFYFYPSPMWYYHIEYPEELNRGYDHHEDLFQPGLIEIPLSDASEVLITASLAEQGDFQKSFLSFYTQRAENSFQMTSTDNLLKPFVIRDTSGHCGITAGYHWFEQWGRDTMISLPGILLVKKDYQLYLDILKSYGQFERRGIIPNFINDNGDHAYNSVDASLWFVWAIQQYIEETNDYHTVHELFFETLKNIYHWYKNGTDYHIGMQENTLLYSGSPYTSITWMDAQTDGKPVTSRHGYAVEINALWYNFICFFHELCIHSKHFEFAHELAEISKQMKTFFREMFWIEEKKYLADCYHDGTLDISVRPNQIFAAAFNYSPLTKKMGTDVLKRVKKELLTPYGLRTLSPADTHYLGRCNGSHYSRDNAYHNGTVWPWLLGFYGEALIRLSSDIQKTSKEIEQLLLPFDMHITEAGIGSISEIFDGDPPHEPRGCIAQAWSVAQIVRLRYMIEKMKKTVGSKHDSAHNALSTSDYL